MRRIAITSLVVTALVCASGAAAQKKPKDEVMYAAMMQQFAEIKASISQLSDRLTALEGELAKVKQQQADVMTEQKSSHTTIKTVDATLSQLRLTNEGSALSLRTDIAQIRTDLGTLSQAVQRVLASGMLAGAPQSAPAPTIEGYISEVKDNEVTISVGSNMNVREGMSFAVFKSSDPKGAQIGTVRVKQVLDGTNSRAEIIFKKPEISAFEFSDVVRQM